MASAPRRDTQNTSTTPNSDSMHISSTIGTASRTMARLMLPSVKFWLEPITASRREDQMLGVRTWIEVLLSLIRTPGHFENPVDWRGCRRAARTTRRQSAIEVFTAVYDPGGKSPFSVPRPGPQCTNLVYWVFMHSAHHHHHRHVWRSAAI